MNTAMHDYERPSAYPPNTLSMEYAGDYYEYQLAYVEQTDDSTIAMADPGNNDGLNGLSEELAGLGEMPPSLNSYGLEIDMTSFTPDEVEPNVPYGFPEPPETGGDPEQNVNRILNWRFNNLGCHIDAVRDTIGTEQDALEWLMYKKVINQSIQSGFSMEKWDRVIELERDADRYVKRLGGDRTVYVDA